jgi:ankyrin repeat protein
VIMKLAVKKESTSLAIFLIEDGADVRSTKKDGSTAFWNCAANAGDADMCRYLVEECGLDLDAKTNDLNMQGTPLFNAACGGFIEVCEYLLVKGASADAGYQPLIVAAQNGYEKVCQLLLAHGANPLHQDCSGSSALFMCSHEGHRLICELLYTHGARNELLYRSDGAVYPIFLTYKGPLHIACQKGHLSVMEFLLDNDADVNTQDHQLMTPLHYAIHERQVDACRLILGYEQVSTQSIESGITMSLIAQSPEIKAMLERELKSRRKVIMV